MGNGGPQVRVAKAAGKRSDVTARLAVASTRYRRQSHDGVILPPGPGRAATAAAKTQAVLTLMRLARASSDLGSSMRSTPSR